MILDLEHIGNIPVCSSAIASLLINIKRGIKKYAVLRLIIRQCKIYERIKSSTINVQVNVPILATLFGVSEKGHKARSLGST